jgi:SHS2 domain-containing protein
VPGFEIIDHTADYAVRARGRDLRELIESAGRGLIALTVATDGLTPTAQRTVSAHADSPEALLVRVLREMLYLLEDEELVAVALEVRHDEGLQVVADVGCVPLEQARERLLGHIKAVTYHDLAVREVGGELQVEIVFDT